MAASLTSPSLILPLSASVAALKAAEPTYKEGVKAVEEMHRSENLLQKKLEEAQRQSQERETAIDRVFKTLSQPTENLAKNLHAQNANAFCLERAMKECDEEFNAELQRIDNLFQNLLIKRQQNSLLLLQNQLDHRIQTIQLGTPFGLLKMDKKLALIAKDLENYPASPLPADEDAQLVWQVVYAAAKIAQESFWNKEKPATSIGKFLEELELFAKNPPHDCVISAQSPTFSHCEFILQRYRDQYTALKKRCVEMWNRSLHHRIQVEIKFAFITSSQELKTSLPELQVKFAKLEKDLETLRHQFKGKNVPKQDEHLKGNRKHLSTQFETLKTTFYNLLLIWKNVQPKCAANLKELETQTAKLNEIAAHALEDPSSVKRLLTEDVPKWLSLFQSAPAAIMAHLEEIALWMDITHSMIANPSWIKFPQRQPFLANLQNLYTKFTTFRDQIKG